MFANSKAFSGFTVDDMSNAREFYGNTLGLKTSEEFGLMTLHLAGDRPTLVYPKPDHAPATYTILNFPVDDIDTAVDELASRGCGSSGTKASSRTRRASSAVGGRISPGLPTRPATSSRCFRRPDARRRSLRRRRRSNLALGRGHSASPALAVVKYWDDGQ